MGNCMARLGASSDDDSSIDDQPTITLEPISTVIITEEESSVEVGREGKSRSSWTAMLTTPRSFSLVNLKTGSTSSEKSTSSESTKEEDNEMDEKFGVEVNLNEELERESDNEEELPPQYPHVIVTTVVLDSGVSSTSSENDETSE